MTDPHAGVGPVRSGPIRLGVAGFGLRGSLARCADDPALGSVVAVVCDTSPRGRSDAAEAFPDATITSELAVLLDADLDAVLVLTPDQLHESVAIAALRARLAVFCEKPLAVSVEGCDAILRTAYETGSRLYVGHNMRLMPAIRIMRRIIAEGRIGTVQTIWCRHFVGNGGDYYFKDWHADRRNSTGLLLQKGSHDIDVIHHLAGGSSASVAAMGDLRVYGRSGPAHRDPGEARMTDWLDPAGWPPTALTDLNPVVDVEDVSLMIMRLDNGVLASYQQCHFTPDYWRNYTIIGDAGRIENLGDGPGGRIALWNRRHARWADPDEVIMIPERAELDAHGGHDGADRSMIAEFVRYVRDGGATATSPISARQAVAAAVAATESLRGDGSARPVPELAADLAAYFGAHELGARS